MPSSPNPKAHKKSAGCFRWLGVFCCLLPLLALQVLVQLLLKKKLNST